MEVVMSFKKNMGSTDRIVRIVLAVIMLIVAFTVPMSGILSTILIILGVVFIGTSLVSFCPLYLPFNLSTLKK
jgi:hypothetical protein